MLDDYTTVITAEPGNEIRVTGELNIATAPILRKQLLQTIEFTPGKVVVDLSELKFIDSTGLGVLVGGVKRVRAYGGEMVLRAVPPSAMKVMEVTSLATVFAFEP